MLLDWLTRRFCSIVGDMTTRHHNLSSSSSAQVHSVLESLFTASQRKRAQERTLKGPPRNASMLALHLPWLLLSLLQFVSVVLGGPPAQQSCGACSSNGNDHVLQLRNQVWLLPFQYHTDSVFFPTAEPISCHRAFEIHPGWHR